MHPFRRIPLAPSVVLLAFGGSIFAYAQLPSAAPATELDHYTAAQLAQQALALKTKAESTGTGNASVILARYPGHFTMLAFRDKSGIAELHTGAADIDVILDGSATLITGGAMVDGKTTGPGEVRSASIAGGQSITINKGDIFHIPANVPHQMLLPPGGSLTYYVIKALSPGQQP